MTEMIILVAHNKKTKHMTVSKSTQAMLTYLLTGKAINIKTCYTLFGFSSPAREVARKIEDKFNLRLEREKKLFKSKYGEPGYYFNYTLSKSDFKKVKKIIDAAKKENTKK